MARNGPRKYSPELVETVVSEHLKGKMSYRDLSKKYHVPAMTIAQWVFKLRNGVDVINSRKRGKQKLDGLLLEDYKERYEILKKYQAFLQARRGKK